MPRIEDGIFAETGLSGKDHEIALATKDINADTTASILAGFDYGIDGETYHFGYDARDQQNFVDQASLCLLHKTGVKPLEGDISWNAYDKNGERVAISFTPDGFLALYTEGALKHKDNCRSAGAEKKSALA